MGKGGGGAPTQQTVTQTNVPEYLQPFMMDLANRAQAESMRTYTPYSGERIAPFTPEQTRVQQEMSGLTTPGQFRTAADFATTAGLGALEASRYAPSQFVMERAAAPSLIQYQMGPAERVEAGQYQAPQMGTARTDFGPQLTTFQMGAPERVGSQAITTRDIQAAQTGFSPQLERFQMTEPGAFTGEAAQQYMSPFQQGVTDIAKRQAVAESQRAQLAQNLGAARQGTYGGARQELARAERERALLQNLSDIQAKGSQAAFESAQQQFERDRAARMGAQRENLAAALGVQQLGTQTGLQAALANLSNEQQARVTSEANRLQAQGMTQDAALRTALANQQAGLTTAQQNLAAQLGVQQLGTQTGLQAALANLSSEQQANVQNLAAQLQTQGLSADQALRAAMANQQAGLTVGQQNLAAALGVQQLGAQQGLQAQLANQQAALEAQRMAEQSRQYGAGLGLKGYEQLGQMGQLLGGLGTAEQTANLGRLAAQGNVAAQQQLMEQQRLDQAYQQFMERQGFGREQLGFLSGMLRGIPGSTSTQYAPAPSVASQLMGLGLGAYGLSRLPGLAKGGLAGLALHHLSGG